MRIRDIANYEGRYAVTDDGRVWSFLSNKWITPKLCRRGKGYFQVQLWEDGEPKNVYIHRLVAVAFVPLVIGKDTVNHKDGDSKNNKFDNLEWTTHQEQQDHAWAVGLNRSGDRATASKLTEEEVDKLRSLEGTMAQAELGDMFGISQAQVSRIFNKKRRNRNASRP